MTDWATAEDVKTYTGIVVTADAIGPAQAIISLFGNVTTDQTDRQLLSTHNTRMLKMATAYQAAWMASRPDVFTNVDVEGVSQDGVSGTYSNENAALLAPLALRCLRRLSWWNRPLNARPPRSGGEDWHYRRGDRDSVGYDDNAPDWLPT